MAPDYLEAALAEMRGTFGTIEAYFAEGLSVDEAAQTLLSPRSSSTAGCRGRTS